MVQIRPQFPPNFYHSKNLNTPRPSPVGPFTLKERLLRPALTSNYQCWFFPTPEVIGWNYSRGFDLNSNNNYELISLSCSDASLPGSSLTTNEINDDYTGTTERHAYRRQYDDRADFTFYVDHARNEGSYNIIWFFENWISFIAGEQRNDASILGFLDQKGKDDYQKVNRESGINRTNYVYNVRYPKEYQSEIYINKFEKDYDDRYIQYKFLQAYPISINSMPVSYESSQLLKCTVSFTYTRYIPTRVENNL